MIRYSSQEAARRLGISASALGNYIRDKKIPSPQSVTTGGITVYLWTEEEIEHVRQLLPKLANGRKTRYKKQSAGSNQQSAKTKAPAGVPVPHKQSKPNQRKSKKK
ncbi:MAG TPA: helix-turn-helix domain-containing protein [Candidatus Angelobacter sp.]|nr:helix-turn-helix domain-containing protein [Candidatus Angelobacter sp.]